MNAKQIIIAMIAICILAAIASFVASSYPDGLEWVAGKLNFTGAVKGMEIVGAPIPDYVIPAIKNRAVSSAIAAVVGTVTVFLAVYLVGNVLNRWVLSFPRKRESNN